MFLILGNLIKASLRPAAISVPENIMKTVMIAINPKSSGTRRFARIRVTTILRNFAMNICPAFHRNAEVDLFCMFTIDLLTRVWVGTTPLLSSVKTLLR